MKLRFLLGVMLLLTLPAMVYATSVFTFAPLASSLQVTDGGGSVFTGTSQAGNVTANNCTNWTARATLATVGSGQSTTATWTVFLTDASCTNNKLNIYCFERP